ncbi:alpha/beta fold hydrolase, partial [Cribrihabitans sp. XS_ASV171]
MAIKILLSLLVGLALLAALTAFFARRHEDRANAAYPPRGELLEIDGVQVHAVVMGAGPDVVLIHGSSGNARDMTFDLAPRLAERYRVIAFDRPGLGFTDRLHEAGATISEQAALLSRAAVALGAERPVVVGHSYGGAVALAWA